MGVPRAHAGAGELRLVWPPWEERIPLSQVERAERTDSVSLRAELGRGVRLGAGGLWGGFGWLLTPKGAR